MITEYFQFMRLILAICEAGYYASQPPLEQGTVNSEPGIKKQKRTSPQITQTAQILRHDLMTWVPRLLAAVLITALREPRCAIRAFLRAIQAWQGAKKGAAGCTGHAL